MVVPGDSLAESVPANEGIAPKNTHSPNKITEYIFLILHLTSLKKFVALCFINNRGQGLTYVTIRH